MDNEMLVDRSLTARRMRRAAVTLGLGATLFCCLGWAVPVHAAPVLISRSECRKGYWHVVTYDITNPERWIEKSAVKTSQPCGESSQPSNPEVPPGTTRPSPPSRPPGTGESPTRGKLQVQLSINRGCGATYQTGGLLTVSYGASQDALVTLKLQKGDTERVLFASRPVRAGVTYPFPGTVGGPGPGLFILEAVAGEQRGRAECGFTVLRGEIGALTARITTDQGSLEEGQNPVYLPGDPITLSIVIGGADQALATIEEFPPDGPKKVIFKQLVPGNQTVSVTGTVGSLPGRYTLQLTAQAGERVAQGWCTFLLQDKGKNTFKAKDYKLTPHEDGSFDLERGVKGKGTYDKWEYDSDGNLRKHHHEEHDEQGRKTKESDEEWNQDGKKTEGTRKSWEYKDKNDKHGTEKEEKWDPDRQKWLPK